jgi:hypothetical protein
MSGEPFHDLEPRESEVVGRWLVVGDARTADHVDQRIRWLTSSRLASLGSASGGWDWLFRDPRDGRLWELTFPESSLHGSGPRRLSVVSPDVARDKYGVDDAR